jgi:hypothetical protein
VLPARNRSAAQLLSREMEILCNDNIYQEALALATTLAELSRLIFINETVMMSESLHDQEKPFLTEFSRS